MAEERIEQIRHTLAHLTVAAVRELWPGSQNAIGPAIDNGFYQDFEIVGTITDADLPKIETKMRELLPKWTGFEKKEVNREEALEEFAWNKYKSELIEEFAGQGKKITFHNAPGLVDLCKGGHSENPAKDIDPSAFKLDRIAGAYWRGNEKNKMLTRIYGLAFETKKELDEYIQRREEAIKRDHRKIGKELDLFVFSDLVGAGLPLFTPKGTVLREEINSFVQELRLKRGFQKVWIPHITKTDLYKTSGHWAKFGHELFLVKSQETQDDLVLKPMNCPHHQQIYAGKPRSYRDLPLRFLETTTVYRDEKSGELSGLSRVRAITQDDSHIFCTPEQIEQEFQSIIEMVKTFFSAVDMSFKARLSFRDPKTPEKYLGEDALWQKAQDIILSIAKNNDLDYFVAEGEAAFYGPKIDFMARDAIGREHQLATPQLDFVQPSRFGLTYTDNDGTEKTPVMIHLAIAGSLERFLSVYIEHTAGAFPTWLAPVQVKVLPISDKHIEYAQNIFSQLRDAGVRVELDDSSETLGKKVRGAKVEKVPYWLVVGDAEVAAHTVTVERREKGKIGAQPLADFLSTLLSEIKVRA